jgi:putative SOS response-associated peptidase YedK
MCNLYSMTRSVDAMRKLFAKFEVPETNLPPMADIFPDYAAPIIRNEGGGHRLAMARWGMPTPQFAMAGRRTDPGVTNVRNTKSPHWRRWLGVENRCLVPFSSFSEFNKGEGGDIWFAFGEERRLAFFAGIWTPQWKSVRKLREGEVQADLYAFLTTEPNAEVQAVHPKAMPVILTTPQQCETWMTSAWPIASYLQRALPDDSLTIVARGVKRDGALF